MKKLMCIAILLLLALPAIAQGKDDAVKNELLNLEKEFWDAWKNKSSKPFEERIAAGSLGVSVEGLGTKEEMLKKMKEQPDDCTVNTYSVDNGSARVMELGRNKYLLVYKSTVDAMCGGQKIPDIWWSSTIWEKQGGKWMGLFHQETPLMMPPPGQQPPKQ
jgi:hypothetical protein